MSTSDKLTRREQDGILAGRTARNYFIAALAAALCSGIYEIFSHGVLSRNMICTFLYPLGSALLFVLFQRGIQRNTMRLPRPSIRLLWHCGTATLAVGSFVTGVLYIYGTTAWFTTVYWIVGPVFLGMAVLLAGIAEAERRKRVRARVAREFAQKKTV